MARKASNSAQIGLFTPTMPNIHVVPNTWHPKENWHITDEHGDGYGPPACWCNLKRCRQQCARIRRRWVYRPDYVEPHNYWPSFYINEKQRTINRTKRTINKSIRWKKRAKTIN